MAAQVYDWTCAACSLTWVLQSTAIAPHQSRGLSIEQIGYPDNINAQYGLMNADGSALRAVYSEYGQITGQGWLDFDTVYQLAQNTTGQMSGAAWYHWVALRGAANGELYIANSAPGYRGVYDVLTRQDFARLGPFSVAWLEQ